MTGTIEAVSIKPLPQPDNYGNTFRASLKIGEDWISYGTIKKETINVKDGNDWVQVAKGMDVEFMYKQNGDFKNIDKKSFTITDASNAQAPQAPRQQSAPAQQPQQAGKNFVNPAMRGQAMNLAAEVLGYKEADFSDAKKIVYAIKWYLTSAKDFESLWDTAEKEIVAGNTPTPKKSKPKVEEPVDEYDDENV